MAYGSNNYYGWVQTRGVASVLMDGTTAGFASTTNLIGAMAYLSTATAGAVSSSIGLVTGTGLWYSRNEAGTPPIGVILHTNVNGSYSAIALNIE